MKLYGKSGASGSTVRVEMGGEAPNYKRGPKSSPDYMEYLEFDYDKHYAIIIPTAEEVQEEALENFGEAALKGKMRTNIKRDKRAARVRAWKRRHGIKTGRHWKGNKG